MKRKITPKPDLQLRKVGRQYMIVEASAGNMNLTNVFSLNETAARLWQKVGEGAFTLDELAAWLGAEYGVSGNAVREDVARQLDEWDAYGLLAGR